MEISKGIYLTWCEELGGSDNRPVFSRNQTYYVFPYDIDRFLLDLSKLRKNHHVFRLHATAKGVDVDL